jgi:hypothetical protein
VGRPPDLRTTTLPGGGTIGGLTFIGSDPVVLYETTVGSGTTIGVDRVALQSGELIPLIPSTPSAEWAGAAGFCGPTSGERCGHFWSIGCALDEPACPGGSAPPCLIVYAKVDSSDPVTTGGYVYNPATGASERLAGQNPDRFFASRDHHLLVWGSSVVPETHYWDLCAGSRNVCGFPPGDAVAWRSDGGAFATFGSMSGLGIAGVADATCASPPEAATAAVYQVQYAPSNDRVAWVAQSSPGDATEILWLAGSTGLSPVAVAQGPSLGAVFSPDGNRLFLARRGVSEVAVSWMDVTAPAAPEQTLSTNYRSVGPFGNRRVLLIDHWNLQDASGDLVLVDLSSGLRQLLGRAVTEGAISGNVDAGSTDVAYAVRSRAASTRDGLWLTTLPP